MASKTNIDIILQKYKTPDKWLGTRATASFEAEVVKALEKNKDYSFDDFKKIYTFLSSNDHDDSATGLDYLYAALNKVMAITLPGCKEAAEVIEAKIPTSRPCVPSFHLSPELRRRLGRLLSSSDTGIRAKEQRIFTEVLALPILLQR